MFRSASLGVFAFLLLCHPVMAQQPRIEAWGGLTLVGASLDTALTTLYVPAIEQYAPPLPGSTAGQTVHLLAGNTVGLGGGLNLFFSRHAGVQFLFATDSRGLTGDNGDYAVQLNYTARQPPDYVERTYSSVERFTPCGSGDAGDAWGCVPPTTGSLRQSTLGVNLVGRWQAGPRVNAELSGGLSYHHARGEAEALRYSSFRLGGHSTLFSQEYQVAYSIGPAHGFGANVGATFDVEFGRGVALTVDARYFGGPAVNAPIVVTGAANADETVSPQDTATIQQNHHPPDVEISPARFGALVGLKIRR